LRRARDIDHQRTCRCSQTCAIASVPPESTSDMHLAPSLMARSVWVRATSTLDSVSMWTTPPGADLRQHLRGDQCAAVQDWPEGAR